MSEKKNLANKMIHVTFIMLKEDILVKIKDIYLTFFLSLFILGLLSRLKLIQNLAAGTTEIS